MNSIKYKQLGSCGLRISPIVMGTMTFGDGADVKESANLFYVALDAGINFFDCANMYANGQSEEILRPLIRERRQDILISSKAYFPVGVGPNDRGCSRHHLTNALHASLKRLGTDYIDIYFLHRFDENTPLAESLSCLNDFVRAGKLRYIGFSNFSAWQCMKALAIQEAMNFDKAVVIQPMYNLLKRQAEVEILPMAVSEGLGVLAYSPLAAGLLTGKYMTGQGGRLDHNEKYRLRYQTQAQSKAIEEFVQMAQELETTPSSLAMAWVMANPAISAPIAGARTVEQLKQSLQALNFELSSQDYQRISNLFPTPPLATDRDEERQ
ncbi:MAG: aldo/keto reductase [Bradymonadales bacterium]